MYNSQILPILTEKKFSNIIVILNFSCVKPQGSSFQLNLVGYQNCLFCLGLK